MIWMKPKDAIKLKEVPLVTRESYPPEEILPEDGLYRYLLQASEEHDDQRHRATDRIWSKASYRLREIAENPGNRMMYYLADGPESAFVSEELTTGTFSHSCSIICNFLLKITVWHFN